MSIFHIHSDPQLTLITNTPFANFTECPEVSNSRRCERVACIDDVFSAQKPVTGLRKELDKLSSEAVSTDMFLSTVRKYTRAKKLTPRMVNELIDHIEVYQAEKIDWEWVQKLTIHYNCIGALFIPDTDSLPVPDVTVNTRRGVYVTYEPAQNEQ